MVRPLAITDTHSHCMGCPDIFSNDELNKAGYCKECWGLMAHKEGIRKYAAEKKSLAEATKRLADEIAARGKNTAISPEFFDAFSRELGGATGLGKRLADDFKRMHGENLDSEDAAFFAPDEKTIQRYWQTITQFMQNQDKLNSVDISSLSDQELQATLLSLATGLIEENEDFRRHVLQIAVQKDVDFLHRLAAEAGIVHVVEGSVAKEAEAESDEVYPEDM